MKQDVPYSIKQMKQVQLYCRISQLFWNIGYPRDLIACTTEDYQLILMEYSIEQGIFNAIFFSPLPEDEEITGDYLSVDESGKLLLIGILEIKPF